MALIPFDDRDGEIWYDGTFVPWREAKVHVLSHGLHYASCVFEGERAYGGTVFKLSEHTQRLHDSAALLGFKIPYDSDVIDAATAGLLKRNGIVDGYVRPIAWRGSEMMAVSAQNTTIHLAIATWPWPSYFPPELKERGIRLKLADWRRPGPDTAPTKSKAAGLYMICTLSKHQAEAQGFHDALMLDYRGLVAETTGANVFIARDGRLHTPTPDCFLDGITRRTVMALARQKGIEVVERHIKLEELDAADEVFITGTAAEVTPIGEIDGRHYQVGALTRALADAYSAEVRAR
ncbi:MAG: branched-chain amino acid aminotransferase [Alphaproteobacteria bacterium]